MQAVSSRTRTGILVWTLAVLTLIWLGVGDQVLTHWAYAVERGRIQASAEELAALHDELPEVHAVSRAFKLVANVARPGVVHLRVEGGRADDEQTDRIREHLRDMIPDDQIDRWLRDHPAPGGMGSGIIFDSDGYIMTNNHVVENRSNITVILHDDREYEAELVGVDPKSDVAVVKIDAPDLHPLRFGDSNLVEVGDWVIAVGAPFGLSQTVTHGIISAVGRTRIVGVDIDYQNFIQTDAAINPGNSGGPLLNLRGEVIGVNTAIATHGEGNAGIAFTIPSNLAVKVANQLKSFGVVRRGWLGIIHSPVDQDDVEIFGLESTQGVLVNAVLEDSPAEQGGLQVEDVIVAVNGEHVRSTDQFRAQVADLVPSERAEFEVVRDGEPKTLFVRLGLQPDDLTVAWNTPLKQSRELPQLGLEVRALRSLRPTRSWNVYEDDQRGVAIMAVDTARVGSDELQPGNLIVSCNGESVQSVGEPNESLQSTPDGSRVRLEILEPTGDRRIISVRRNSAE